MGMASTKAKLAWKGRHPPPPQSIGPGTLTPDCESLIAHTKKDVYVQMSDMFA
jgi:hypothetical protein